MMENVIIMDASGRRIFEKASFAGDKYFHYLFTQSLPRGAFRQ